MTYASYTNVPDDASIRDRDNSDRRMLTPNEVATALRCSVKTALARMRDIGAVNIGLGKTERLRIDRSAFIAWVDAYRESRPIEAAISDAAARCRKNYVVYFIQSPDGGLIKIGFSRGLDLRLAELRKYSSCDLSLIASVRGDIILEQWFHKRFAADRERGEWFRPSTELLHVVALIGVRFPESKHG